MVRGLVNKQERGGLGVCEETGAGGRCLETGAGRFRVVERRSFGDVGKHGVADALIVLAC